MYRDPWVATLKPGDPVAVQDPLTGEHLLRRVVEVTASGRIRIRSGNPSAIAQEFNPDGALRGGGTWNKVYLRPVTPEIREEIEKRKLVLALRPVLPSLPLLTLRAMAVLVKDALHETPVEDKEG